MSSLCVHTSGKAYVRGQDNVSAKESWHTNVLNHDVGATQHDVFGPIGEVNLEGLNGHNQCRSDSKGTNTTKAGMETEPGSFDSTTTHLIKATPLPFSDGQTSSAGLHAILGTQY